MKPIACILCFATGTLLGQSPDSRPNIKFEADAEWKTVDMRDLEIKEGSALDASAIAAGPNSPGSSAKAGRASVRPLPRLGISPKGKLAVEGRPKEIVRLRGHGVNTPWIFGRANHDPNWKETWKGQAVLARRLGYNLLRVGFDSMSADDLNLAPAMIDKADYLVSQFGAQGSYTFLTIGSYGLYLKNAWGPLKPGQRRDYCMRMYLGDEQVRKAWKYGAETLMNHVNAYTGVAWKDDPQVACVELYNEQEWGFFHPKSRLTAETRTELDAKFREWLEGKYKTPAELAKAWENASLSSFSQVTTPETFPADSRKPQDNDYILFCGELSHSSAKWMRETLRATGYKGIVAQYNISHWLAGQEARWGESQTTIANTYHEHPTGFDTPGSKCGQSSSVGGAGGYWRGIASLRFADRPFIETEYNHSFWNPYQHEGGILFGAYSALQGLDGLMVHSSAVFYYADRPGLSTFCVGQSPTLRANEFLLGFLYLRGDVKASPHRVELQISKDYLEARGNGGRMVSTDQNKLALLTGFSIAFPWAKRAEGVGNPRKPDLVLAPSDSAEFKSAGGGWAINAQESTASSFSLDAAVADMKAKGLLPQANISAPSEGIFQSDTRELTMRTKENLLKVATRRSEAVTLEGGRGEPVGQLEVVNTDVPALVAACAVDKKPLSRSKRIVLIYSTDTANTGMELSADRTTLVNLGKPPVLMKTGKLDAILTNSNGAKMSLYALGFDGTRREKLPMKAKGNVLSISVITSSLKDGPTPFFELVKEN